MAVRHALAALAAVQWARYALPSTSWRNRWSGHHQETFTLALRLAGTYASSFLVAQLLELARGQVLLDGSNLGRSGPKLKLLNLLDAALSPPILAAGDPVDRVDPVRQPTPVRAGGPLQVPYAGSAPIDLELELASLAGPCWYWAGVTVADEYVWTVRSPRGAWWHGRASIAEGTPARRAYDDLLCALPLSRPGENERERQSRLRRSQLARTRVTAADQPKAELRLLGGCPRRSYRHHWRRAFAGRAVT
jgi:hypothetical protein